MDTTVMAVVGSGSAFDALRSGSSKVPSDAIVLVEVLDSETHWMSPGDYSIPSISVDRPKLGSCYGPGFHVAFVDGTVWYLSTEVPSGVLNAFLSVQGAEAADREDALAAFIIP